MSKTKWLFAAAFSIAYALVFSLGFVCFMYLFEGYLVAAVFGESFLKDYPRFAPFCLIVGLSALATLFAVFGVNRYLSKKYVFGKAVWCVQMLVAFAVSIPMMELWTMLIEYLRIIF